VKDYRSPWDCGSLDSAEYRQAQSRSEPDNGVSTMLTETKINILSIEDNQTDQAALERFISNNELPYEVTAVADAVEARQALAEEDYDLVLSEYRIGSSTALDLVSELDDTELILLTREGSAQIATSAIKSGAADYLVKDDGHEYLKNLPAVVENVVLDGRQKKKSRQYHQQLEKIAAESAHLLTESNQRLTDESSQRTRALHELKESKEIYRRFFQTSHDAVFITGADGGWIDMNQSAIDLFGFEEKGQLLGVNTFDLFLDPVESERFTSTIQEQGFTRDYRVKLRKKDGRVFEALISATLYIVADQFAGYQGAIRDISQKVRGEEQRHQLLKQQNALDKLSQDVASTLELDSLYQCITDHVRKLFEVKTLIVSKYDTQRDTIEAKYAWYHGKLVDPGRLQNLNLDKIGHGIKSGVIRSQQTDYIPDLKRYLRETGPLDASALETAKMVGLDSGRADSQVSTLVAPVEVDGQVIGALQIMNERLDAYSEEEADLLTKIANVVAIGLQKAYLYEESERLVERLTTLNTIEQTILENLSLTTTLDMLVDQVVRELEVDAVDILYYHPKLNTLKLIAETGFNQKILQDIDLEIGEGYAGLAAKTGTMVQVPDLAEEHILCSRALEFASEKFVSYFAVPLNAKGKLVGVLEIFRRSPLDPDPQRLELFEMVAGLAAICIDHQNLQKDLERSRAEIVRGFDAIIEGWALALELRGIESPGHADRVVDLSSRLGQELGLDDDSLTELRRGALLHDIGKMGIPDQVLHKGKELTKEERKMIGRHPVDAFNLLGQIDALQSARDIPLYHHERWNGEGYPDGLKGDKIPFQARIFAIVDVWDALLTDRPYRDAWPRDKAVAHIREQSGKHFDPVVVEKFLEILKNDEIK